VSDKLANVFLVTS